MHLFGHYFDHDYYFELLRKEERAAQSITRCSASHHRLLRAGPNLLPALKALGFSDDQHKSQRREWTDTRMSHELPGFGVLFCFLLDGLAQFRDAGVQSIQQPRRSRRSRLAHGANGKDSSCLRPRSRHNLFLQRRPSLSAIACS